MCATDAQGAVGDVSRALTRRAGRGVDAWCDPKRIDGYEFEGNEALKASDRWAVEPADHGRAPALGEQLAAAPAAATVVDPTQTTERGSRGDAKCFAGDVGVRIARAANAPADAAAISRPAAAAVERGDATAARKDRGNNRYCERSCFSARARSSFAYHCASATRSELRRGSIYAAASEGASAGDARSAMSSSSFSFRRRRTVIDAPFLLFRQREGVDRATPASSQIRDMATPWRFARAYSASMGSCSMCYGVLA